MRIIHCLRAPVGGLFRHVLDLGAAQAELGHDVGMIADSSVSDALTEAKFAAILPAMSLGIARLPMPRAPGWGDLKACRAVAEHVRPLNLDILHGHGAKGGAYARIGGRMLKARQVQLRVFYTPHGGTLHYPKGSLEGRVYQAIERGLDGFTDGLIFESAFAAKTYGEIIGPGRAARRVVHNGLGPRDFAPHRPNGDAADILFVGELRELKGVDVLLRALARLNAVRAQPLTAVIVGSGPDAATLRALAEGLGLSDAVHFPGAMPAERAFKLGRILAVPSRKESFPYIVLEAAAAGLPLVATEVGGIGEIVRDSDTTLIPAGDVEALAAALSLVNDHPDLAQAKAQRLREVVSSRFTVAQMTRSVLDFYGEVGVDGASAGVCRGQISPVRMGIGA